MTTFAQPFHDYEILDRVGAGAMGTVFKARHKKLNRIVALKVLKPSLARDARYVDRLRREARIVASLSHPHIVTGYDIGEEGGYHFFVMEFVEGKSLRALLVEWGMFAEEYVRRVARQVALALDHAYQRNVIHRDIKPGNILIDDAGDVKLTDMGLAKGPADMTLTRDGATVGTPQYISPEQARNPQDVDVRSDLYSLGATLYHMATGMPPFRGDTMAELITNVLNKVPTPPDEANPALSPGMSLVIRKLLAKNLTVRYQTPRELLDDLDRIERSLPPAVDAGRLLAESTEPVAWWRLSLLAAAVALLLGVAWWIGVQSREPVVPEQTVEEFLVQLDADLAALPTPGAQLVRLSTITTAPEGSALPLAQRRRQASARLQATVDDIVGKLLGDGWPQVVRWLRDPTVWPDEERVERVLLQPRIEKDAGVDLGQLPPSVRQQRLGDLQRAIERELAARDAELVTRFAMFLSTRLQALADERLRASDFAGADNLWRDALRTFCDGVGQPLPERLPRDVLRVLTEKQEAAHAAARREIERVESSVAAALRAEVEAVLARMRERLAASVDPEVVAEALQRFRRELDQTWPSPGRFRLGNDPWPEVVQRLATMQQEIALASAALGSERFARRCDQAWRALVHGRAEDGLAVLAGSEPATAQQAERLERHRAALAAALSVEQALLRAVSRTNRPPVAFPVAGGSGPVELSAEPQGEGLTLVGQGAAQPPRPVHFTEFHLAPLLAQLQQAAAAPLGELPGSQRELGLSVLRLVGDDLAAVQDHIAGLPAEQQSFLFDEVWPRILRVRDDRTETPFDQKQLFVQLRRAREEAERRGALLELESALAAAERGVPLEERSQAELREVRRARELLELSRRRNDLANELTKFAPRGAGTEVHIDDQRLVAEVVLAAPVLHAGATEGWQLRGDFVEFAAGGRSYDELRRLRIAVAPGIDAQVPETRMTCELVVPPSTAGRRFWLFEFRGITCLLLIAADDSVHVALVDGDASAAANVQAAFRRALLDAMAPARAIAIAGAVHRLTIDVVATSSRRYANVKIAFEGAELLHEQRHLDPDRPPSFALHPLQDVALRRVVVRAIR